MKKNDDHLQDVENYLNRPNLRIIGVQEGVETEQSVESLLKKKWEKILATLSMR